MIKTFLALSLTLFLFNLALLNDTVSALDSSKTSTEGATPVKSTLGQKPALMPTKTPDTKVATSESKKTGVKETLKEKKADVKEIINEKKQEVKDLKASKAAELKTLKQEAKEKVQEKKQELGD